MIELSGKRSHPKTLLSHQYHCSWSLFFWYNGNAPDRWSLFPTCNSSCNKGRSNCHVFFTVARAKSLKNHDRAAFLIFSNSGLDFRTFEDHICRHTLIHIPSKASKFFWFRLITSPPGVFLSHGGWQKWYDCRYHRPWLVSIFDIDTSPDGFFHT